MSYVLTKLLRAFGKDIEKMIMIRIKLMCKQAYPTHEGLKIKIETSTKQSIKTSQFWWMLLNPEENLFCNNNKSWEWKKIHTLKFINSYSWQLILFLINIIYVRKGGDSHEKSLHFSSKIHVRITLFLFCW